MLRHEIPVALLSVLLTQTTLAADSLAEVQLRLDELQRQVEILQEQIRRAAAEDAEKQTIDAELVAGDVFSVDLEPQQLSSFDEAHDSSVLANPWWRNIDITGFAAAGFYDTGSAGARDKGGFEIKEASLFIAANVWDNAAFFLEFQTNRLGRDGDQFTRTGEVYLHFFDIPISESMTIGMKLGRIDIPFGEEYLWQDAFDNPLITNSAGWPYGTDEGIAVYGDLHGVDWIFSITDGLLFRGREENADKAINLKVSGRPLDSLYVSLSAMRNGDTSVSSMQFAGSFLQPIGGFGQQSTLGVSPSPEIGASLAELDTKYEFSFSSYDAYLALSYGVADIDDDDSAFDRSFDWFSIEPSIRLNQNWYAILRYSEIGTNDDDKGYHFDGKTFAGGNSAFGYDTKRLQRLSLGLGWTPNPNIRAKLEFASDRFELIDTSAFSPNNSNRKFVGFELAAGF